MSGIDKLAGAMLGSNMDSGILSTCGEYGIDYDCNTTFSCVPPFDCISDFDCGTFTCKAGYLGDYNCTNPAADFHCNTVFRCVNGGENFNCGPFHCVATYTLC